MHIILLFTTILSAEGLVAPQRGRRNSRIIQCLSSTTGDNDQQQSSSPANEHHPKITPSWQLTETREPFDLTTPLFQRSWGQHPLLWRQAFPTTTDLTTTTPWPSFQEMMERFMYNPRVEGTRLIQHTPGQLDSFQQVPIPFPSLEQQQQQQQHSNNNTAFTFVQNDVDHYHPPLADWIDATFGTAIPRWRRDDAQISCTPVARGGIGPHYDQYDVWLIQTSGRRTWRLHPPLKMMMTRDRSEWLATTTTDVAILDPQAWDTDETVDIIVEPGDCLYLPPRWLHWGTALADNNDDSNKIQCQTLSVGCRSPNVGALLAGVAEHVDPDWLFGGYNNTTSQQRTTTGPSLTALDKTAMKQVVRDAVESVLSNEAEWDAIVGTIATEPLRYLEVHSLEEDDDDELIEALQDIVRMGKKGGVQRTPGISIATTRVSDGKGGYTDRFYAKGKLWELSYEEEAAQLFRSIESGTVVSGSDLALLSEASFHCVEKLVQNGVVELLEEMDDEDKDELASSPQII